MQVFTIGAGLNRQSCALLFCAGFLLAAGLATPHEALAETEGDDVRSADSQPLQHLPAELEDGLLPISQIVPRAKIVLKEREHLPDRGAERTFAAFGALKVNNIPWYDRGPHAPMYGLAYHPIYFEDMNLERCGLTYGCCLQPIASGLHFYLGFAVLPYKVLVAPPRSYLFAPIDSPPDCRFSCCENFFGPKPSVRPPFGCWLHRRDCP